MERPLQVLLKMYSEYSYTQRGVGIFNKTWEEMRDLFREVERKWKVRKGNFG